jgi:hypothetical protein
LVDVAEWTSDRVRGRASFGIGGKFAETMDSRFRHIVVLTSAAFEICFCSSSSTDVVIDMFVPVSGIRASSCVIGATGNLHLLTNMLIGHSQLASCFVGVDRTRFPNLEIVVC